MELTREQIVIQVAEKRDWLNRRGAFLGKDECLLLLDTIDALQSRLDQLKQIEPCGHPIQCLVGDDHGLFTCSCCQALVTATSDALRAAKAIADIYRDNIDEEELILITGITQRVTANQIGEAIERLSPTTIRQQAELRELEVRKVALNDALKCAIEEMNTPESEGGNIIRHDACDNVRIMIRSLILDNCAAISKVTAAIEAEEKR